MHQQVNDHIELIKKKHPTYFENKRVLEVGSLDINGGIRHHFVNCDYTGIDLGEGKGVDMVSHVHKFKSTGLYDVIVSTEMLEHDKYWELSLQSMYDKLKKGGLLILTCAAPARREHGTTRADPNNSPFTNDYYRNISVEDFSNILLQSNFSLYNLKYGRGDEDLYFYAIKK